MGFLIEKILSHCEEMINIMLNLGIYHFEYPHFLTFDWLLIALVLQLLKNATSLNEKQTHILYTIMFVS